MVREATTIFFVFEFSCTTTCYMANFETGEACIFSSYYLNLFTRCLAFKYKATPDGMISWYLMCPTFHVIAFTYAMQVSFRSINQGYLSVIRLLSSDVRKFVFYSNKSCKRYRNLLLAISDLFLLLLILSILSLIFLGFVILLLILLLNY